MTALIIVLVGLVLAGLYGWFLNRMPGDLLMALGYRIFVPWAVIAIGAAVALLVLT